MIALQLTTQDQARQLADLARWQQYESDLLFMLIDDAGLTPAEACFAMNGDVN